MKLLKTCLALLAGLTMLTLPAAAQYDYSGPERILQYDSEIQVNADSSVDVTENIRFNVRNESIRHGILRDMPIQHAANSRVHIPLRILDIRLDGSPEKYSVEHASGYTRIRIGSEDSYVSTGEHVYTIRYHLDRQVRRFDKRDELYWNVTGNAWTFPIDRVSATVILPGSLTEHDVTMEAYTGAFGSKGQDYSTLWGGHGHIYYESTRPFAAYEGMTIDCSFPRGTAVADNPLVARQWWIKDNGYWAAALLLLGAAFLWWLLQWWRFGKDPTSGLVLATQSPLADLSAAQVRYLWKLGADNGLLSVVMLQLAQKGWLTINEDSAGKYSLTRTNVHDGELLPEERAFIDVIFSGNSRRFEVDEDNYQQLSTALTTITELLRRQMLHVHFESNSSVTAHGVWLCIAGFLIYLLLGFSGVMLPNYVVAVFLGLMLIIMMIFFGLLMPARTALGKAVLNRIQGFRLAMTGGEDSLGEYVYADTVLSERYLPYAAALDVNKQWGEHFNEVMERRGQKVQQPSWYHSSIGNDYYYNGGFSYAHFSTGMPRSFSHAVSHSTSPPSSSSSGSGGGGFSGGGGGGGGGSGW